MRTLHFVLLTFFVGGCASRALSPPVTDDDGPPAGRTDGIAIPLETYKRCATGVSAMGGALVNVVGFQPDAALTLAQSDGLLVVTYPDLSGEVQTLRFSPSTRTTASLVPMGQRIAASSVSCLHGLGDIAHVPASLNPTAGTLTYRDGTILVAAEGVLESAGDGDKCGPVRSSASLWIVCDDGEGSAPADSRSPPTIPVLPVGKYDCSTQLATSFHHDGMDAYLSSGRAGTLSVTEEGDEIVARYDGDPSLTGTLRLTGLSSEVAIAEAGQHLTALCGFPGFDEPPPSATSLEIDAAALMVEHSTIILSFAGALDSTASCMGARMDGGLVCTR